MRKKERTCCPRDVNNVDVSRAAFWFAGGVTSVKNGGGGHCRGPQLLSFWVLVGKRSSSSTTRLCEIFNNVTCCRSSNELVKKKIYHRNDRIIATSLPQTDTTPRLPCQQTSQMCRVLYEMSFKTQVKFYFLPFW
jgi:hypothetical protein